MRPWDPTGKAGPKKPLPDNVSIVEPKEETAVAQPYSDNKDAKDPAALGAAAAVAGAPAPAAAAPGLPAAQPLTA